MMKPAILGIARHLLTAAGGALAARGAIEAGEVETIVGAGVTLIGLIWSIWEKRGR